MTPWFWPTLRHAAIAACAAAALAPSVRAQAPTPVTTPAPARASAASAAFGVPELMRLLAGTRAGSATFVEERRIQSLEQTLHASGRLSFAAPDTFVRETLRPVAETMAVRGNQVTLGRDGRSRTMALDALPEAKMMVDAIRGTLTGDAATLAAAFDASVAGAPAQWTLRLVPRDARLRGQVASLELGGQRGVVRQVRVQMADGDTSLMTIRPVDEGSGAGLGAGAGASPGPATVRPAPAGPGAAPDASPAAPRR